MDDRHFDQLTRLAATGPDGTTSALWLPHSSCRSSCEPVREPHSSKAPSSGRCLHVERGMSTDRLSCHAPWRSAQTMGLAPTDALIVVR